MEFRGTLGLEAVEAVDYQGQAQAILTQQPQQGLTETQLIQAVAPRNRNVMELLLLNTDYGKFLAELTVLFRARKFTTINNDIINLAKKYGFEATSQDGKLVINCGQGVPTLVLDQYQSSASPVTGGSDISYSSHVTESLRSWSIELLSNPVVMGTALATDNIEAALQNPSISKALRGLAQSYVAELSLKSAHQSNQYPTTGHLNPQVNHDVSRLQVLEARHQNAMEREQQRQGYERERFDQRIRLDELNHEQERQLRAQEHEERLAAMMLTRGQMVIATFHKLAESQERVLSRKMGQYLLRPPGRGKNPDVGNLLVFLAANYALTRLGVGRAGEYSSSYLRWLEEMRKAWANSWQR